MSLSPRNPNRLSRRERERRAYGLVLATGVLGVVAVGGFVLALVTSFSWGVPTLAGIGAALCGWLFRRTVSS